MITKSKIADYDIHLLSTEIKNITQKIKYFETKSEINAFEKELSEKLSDFNNKFFPSPQFKREVYTQQVNETTFGQEKEAEFLSIYNSLIKKYHIKLKQEKDYSFLDKRYIKNTRDEIDFIFEEIKKIKNTQVKELLAIILSRTIRSCRATTHSDLTTLKKPQLTTYYCFKHKKICKPLFSIKHRFLRYASDTLERIKTFSALKTNTF